MAASQEPFRSLPASISLRWITRIPWPAIIPVSVWVSDGTDTTSHTFTASVALGSSLPKVSFVGGNLTVDEIRSVVTIEVLLTRTPNRRRCGSAIGQRVGN